MTRKLLLTFSLLLGYGVVLSATEPQPDSPPKYTLRYRFQPGETLRWKVEHRTRARTTVSGQSQTVETTTTSIKLWRVKTVHPDGSATFELIVDDVDMRHLLSGRDEVRYRSGRDQPPPGFEHITGAVGVPISLITLDSQGKLRKREKTPAEYPIFTAEQITIPLPPEPIAVGHSWSIPQEVDVATRDERFVRLKLVQGYTLKDVRNGVATIEVATRVLSPVPDATAESQIIQRQVCGTVRFDIKAGRVLSQQLEVDKHVVGFRGEASSVHYAMRFNEEFVATPLRTASAAASSKLR